MIFAFSLEQTAFFSGEVYSVESLTVIYETSSQGRSSSHTKGCISMKSAPEEKLAAESFLSSFPHFVRVMKKFNVSGSYTLVGAFSLLLSVYWCFLCLANNLANCL